jgi:gamma-glutamylcyclotransferase (GGCT)/AIG2-like uncharacterized protein YtfP
MPHPLFIYGTLHPDRAPAAIAASARRLKRVGAATIQGRLLDLGEYPGVILSADPFAGGDDTGSVQGELFALPAGDEAEEVLERLDAYEDFRPGDVEGSLFLRQLTVAVLSPGGPAGGAEVTCWVYTYNRRIV